MAKYINLTGKELVMINQEKEIVGKIKPNNEYKITVEQNTKKNTQYDCVGVMFDTVEHILSVKIEPEIDIPWFGAENKIDVPIIIVNRDVFNYFMSSESFGYFYVTPIDEIKFNGAVGYSKFLVTGNPKEFRPKKCIDGEEHIYVCDEELSVYGDEWYEEFFICEKCGDEVIRRK